MAIGNKLLVVIDADVKGAIREIDKLGTKAEGSLSGTDAKIDKFANGAIRFGAAVSAGAAVAGVGLYKAAQQASDLNESITKSEVVFGRQGNAVTKWAGGLADSFGLSKREALAAAGAFGSMFRTTGLAGGEAAKMSKRMTELAGDMASFNNEDPSEMLDRLRSGLAGEAEPLRRFGVLLSEARVQSFAYANGIAKTGEKLTEAQKVQARYGLILKDTKLQQGDFARTADGAANSQRAFNAQIDNLVSSVGQAALPILKNVTGALADMAGAFNDADQASGGVLGKVATIGVVAAGAVGGLLLLSGAIVKVKTAMAETTANSAAFGNAIKGIGFVGGAAATIAIAESIKTVVRSLQDELIPSSEEARDAVIKFGGDGKKAVDKFKDAVNSANSANPIKDLLGGGDISDVGKDFAKSFRNITNGGKETAAEIKRQFREIINASPSTAKSLLNSLKADPETAKDFAGTLRVLGRMLDDEVTKRANVADAARKDAEMVARHTQAEKDNTAAVDAAVDAMERRRTALLASFSSDIAAQQAVQGLGETLKNSQDPLEKQADLLSTAGSMAQAMADKLEAQGVKVDDAATKNDLFKQALQQLAEKYPELRGQVDLYAASLANQQLKTQWMLDHPKIAQYVELAFSVTGAAQVNDMITKLGTLGALIGRNALDDLFRAAGGPVKSGQPYIVGEKGPEIFVPNGSGRIINARDSAASLKSVGSSSGGSGNTYVINVNSLVPTAATGQLIREHLHKAERAGVTTSSVAG